MAAMTPKTVDFEVKNQEYFKNYANLSNIHLMNTPFSVSQVHHNGQGTNPQNPSAQQGVMTISSETDPSAVQIGDRAMQGNIEGIVTAVVVAGTKLNAIKVSSTVVYLGGDLSYYLANRIRKFIYVVNDENGVTVNGAADETVIRADVLQLNGTSLQISPLNR